MILNRSVPHHTHTHNKKLALVPSGHRLPFLQMPVKPAHALSALSGSSRPRPLVLLFMAMVAMALLGLSREFYAISADGNGDSEDDYGSGPMSGGSYVHYPEELFETDWSKQVPASDQLDLGRIHKACMRYNVSFIPWDIGRGRIPVESAIINESDPNLLARLKKCADVDIFVPHGIRHNGYCEDAAAYAKYLHARLLPKWVNKLQLYDPSVGRRVGYHELCPTTPTIFFNHYYDGFLDDSVWPVGKKMVLMPNLEMHELQAEQYMRADVVLCKTAVCVRYLKGWFKMNGNPRKTKVLYTRHTSTDVSALVRAALPAHELSPKNYQDVSFIHTAGTSIQKGSAHVFDCWSKRPDLPPVDIYMAPKLYDDWFKKQYDKVLRNRTNVRLHLGKMNEIDFGHLIVESSFFLCTSLQEGYGHYINQARASGGLILTPNVPPMNELITPSSGVLVEARGEGNEHQFLGGNGAHPLALKNVTGFIAKFGGKEVCAAVDHVIKNLTAGERQRKAERARQQYFFDTVFFVRAMDTLRRELSLPSLMPGKEKPTILRSP